MARGRLRTAIAGLIVLAAMPTGSTAAFGPDGSYSTARVRSGQEIAFTCDWNDWEKTNHVMALSVVVDGRSHGHYISGYSGDSEVSVRAGVLDVQHEVVVSDSSDHHYQQSVTVHALGFEPTTEYTLIAAWATVAQPITCRLRIEGAEIPSTRLDSARIHALSITDLTGAASARARVGPQVGSIGTALSGGIQTDAHLVALFELGSVGACIGRIRSETSDSWVMPPSNVGSVDSTDGGTWMFDVHACASRHTGTVLWMLELPV